MDRPENPLESPVEHIDRVFAQEQASESPSRDELAQQLLGLLQPQLEERASPSAPDRESTREQPELSRLIALLKSRLETLEDRERRVAEQEADLTRRMNWVVQAELENQNLQRQSHDLIQEIEARQRQLDQVRAEAGQVGPELEQARVRNQREAKALQDQQQLLAEQEVQIARQRKNLEDRFRELHRAEAGLAQRLKELDQLQGRAS
jgi:chromosome segregation ATPase